MAINQSTFIGNLTKRPELRYTSNGIAVTNLSVAINDRKNDNTYFVSVVAWRKLAEHVCNFLDKGSKVCVQGQLTTRIYERSEQDKRLVTEVVANQIEFLSFKNKKEHANAASNPSNENSNTIDIDDDDLPF